MPRWVAEWRARRLAASGSVAFRAGRTDAQAAARYVPCSGTMQSKPRAYASFENVALLAWHQLHVFNFLQRSIESAHDNNNMQASFEQGARAHRLVCSVCVCVIAQMCACLRACKFVWFAGLSRHCWPSLKHR